MGAAEEEVSSMASQSRAESSKVEEGIFLTEPPQQQHRRRTRRRKGEGGLGNEADVDSVSKEEPFSPRPRRPMEAFFDARDCGRQFDLMRKRAEEVVPLPSPSSILHWSCTGEEGSWLCSDISAWVVR